MRQKPIHSNYAHGRNRANKRENILITLDLYIFSPSRVLIEWALYLINVVSGNLYGAMVDNHERFNAP